MTKMTFRTIAEKYDIFEEDVERIFACYDTNDMIEMRSAIGYCFFCMGHGDVEFLFDIICYIKQCEIEQHKEKGKDTMKINIVIDYDYADKRIQALKKTKKLIDKEINDFIKERETPPPICGYGVSEKIRKLFED